jgi:hypothetical protein
MDRQKFEHGMRELGKWYNREITTAIADAYFSAVGTLSDAEWSWACKSVVAGNAHMPTAEALFRAGHEYRKQHTAKAIAPPRHEVRCVHCLDTVAIPVYLGGGYTGIARCEECARSREIKPRRGPDGEIEVQNRVFHGLVSFRKFMGRAPDAYFAEWRETARRQATHIATGRGCRLDEVRG